MKPIEKRIKDVIASECCNHQASGTECYWAEYEDEERLIIKEHKHYCITYDGTCPLFNVLDNDHPESDIRVFMSYNPDICSRFTQAILPAHKDISDYLYNNTTRSKKKCKNCNKYFTPLKSNREMYCCDACRQKARKKQYREAKANQRCKEG